MASIYMPLVNEGTDVFRPVDATYIRVSVYRIEGEMPPGEEWIYLPGTAVQCERKELSTGEALVAVNEMT